ncbi:putative mitochondrial protein [Vitis vinifera]|uniref:Putative mitochondrial protein n=1 Tax=Vitis vinifera TaxID=29760 RepID=A0A438DPT0_VITVI|nr:putative mitochondrial protein [Vitis vinifera]
MGNGKFVLEVFDVQPRGSAMKEKPSSNCEAPPKEDAFQMPEGFNPLKSKPSMPNEEKKQILHRHLRPTGTGLEETKRMVCDKRFVGSVWTIRNKEWATLPACGALANEIVDEKRRSREEGVVFKINFEKAYDHVSWDFLDHVLEKKGFSPRWRNWMRGCLSMVSFAVLVNGNAKGWVKASRGLTQGDPLSPFLFTIVTDVLSRMMLTTEERSLLEGFRVGRNRTRVSHLQFADDTIFFSNTYEEELQTLKSLLLVFGHIYGLKASDWSILYLGLLLGGNPKACGFWDPVIERILRRLDG